MASIETREQFTNVRIETRDKRKMKNAIKHSLRTVKVASNQKYVQRRINGKNTWIDNPNHGKANMYWFNGEDPTKTDWTTDERKAKARELIAELGERENLHRKRLREHKNRSLQKGRVYSWADGVFTLSSSIAEMVENDREKVFELGVKTILHMCEELGTECHYITLDLDEAGLPHFQYYMDNFDKEGNAINASRRKSMGQRCQDLGNVFFKELGFARGIPKEQSGRKHEDIRTFQANQDTKKELEELEERVRAAEAKAAQAEANLDEARGALEEEVLELIRRRNEISRRLEALGMTDELADFLKLWNRYAKGNMGRLRKLLDKYEGVAGNGEVELEAAEREAELEEEKQAEIKAEAEKIAAAVIKKKSTGRKPS